MSKLMRISFVLVLLIAALPTPPLQAREGFGIVKKLAVITRLKAPQVQLPGSRISVRPDPSSANFGNEGQRLAQMVETDMLSADSRLTSASSAPDIVVEIAVLQSVGDRQTTTREVTKSRAVGKDSEGNTKYQYYQDRVTDYHFTYAFEATYRVDDVRSGDARTVHADSFSRSYQKKFTEGDTLPTEDSLRDDALAAAAQFIVPRLVPTREAFQVLIPKGSFKDLIPLAENGHWSLYLQGLTDVPPVKKPENEAYRDYAFGMAYEALGYNAENPDQTLRYLEQALVHYNRAIERKPSEEYFLEAYESGDWAAAFAKELGSEAARRHAEAPLDRVRTSMLSYETIKTFQEQGAVAPMVAGSKSLDAAVGSKAPAPSGMTNQQVINMVRAELGNDIIIHAIETCEEHSFDISPDGLIQLSRAGVDAAIIKAVQKRVRP